MKSIIELYNLSFFDFWNPEQLFINNIKSSIRIFKNSLYKLFSSLSLIIFMLLLALCLYKKMINSINSNFSSFIDFFS